jgi:hypothetical protein
MVGKKVLDVHAGSGRFTSILRAAARVIMVHPLHLLKQQPGFWRGRTFYGRPAEIRAIAFLFFKLDGFASVKPFLPLFRKNGYANCLDGI